MTEEQFLARCRNAYQLGLTTDMRLMERWLDFVMRLGHTLFSYGQSQGNHVWDFLEVERDRLGKQQGTLANDTAGYGLIRFAAIMAHPCQLCAVNPDAWHTRPGYCDHKREQVTMAAELNQPASQAAENIPELEKV